MKDHLSVCKTTLFAANYSFRLTTALSTECASWFDQYLSWYTDRKTIYGSAVKCHLLWVLENVPWWGTSEEALSFTGVAGRTPEGANGHERILKEPHSMKGCCVFCHTDVCDPFQTNAQVCPAQELLVELQQLCCLCSSAVVQEHFNPNKIASSAVQAFGQCVWDVAGPQEQKIVLEQGYKGYKDM